MQLLSLIILALSSVSFTAAQAAEGLIDLSPIDNAKLISDLNQYVPEKRNRFHWEIKKPDAKECSCNDPYCPTGMPPEAANQCRYNHEFACYRRSKGSCPMPKL